MVEELGFGCVGIGQCGVNIAKHFAKFFPTIAIDTNKGNLEDCPEIKEDLKYWAEDKTGLGGAGKRGDVGEKIIVQHMENIIDLIEKNLSECSFVWVAAGIGGGTGTAGSIVIANALNSLGIPFGLFVTLPEFDTSAGIDEIENAYHGLKGIEKARVAFEELNNIIIIDNKKLKERVEVNDNFENAWNERNKYVFDQFYQLYKYTKKKSSHSFDGKDYKELLRKSGYMIFGEITVEDVDNSSENILVNKVKETWEDGIFIDNLQFNSAKGMGIIIDRPTSYVTDGKAIDNLIKAMKGYLGFASIYQGIYETKEGWLKNKNKPLKIITAISGMPFPLERFNQIKELREMAKEEYKSKEKIIQFDDEEDDAFGMFETQDENKKEKKKLKNFSVFGRGFDRNNNEDKHKTKEVKTKLQWEDF